MSTAVWKLNNVLASTLDIHDLQVTLANMAVDRLTFTCDRAVDAAALFATNASVTLTRDNVKWFQGVINRPPRSGSSQSESHSYEVCGGWWYLERLAFQQAWQSGEWVGETWTPKTVYKSRVILGQSAAGVAQTSGAVIREIIAYAASCGVPLAAGAIDEGTAFPWDEVIDLTCSEAIKRVSRWTPDAVGWVDYSAAVPTFNWRRQSNLTAKVPPPADIEALEITQRDDLRTPAVVLKYEVTFDVDGKQMTSIVTDAYPAGATGRELGAVTQTIQLSGGSSNTVKQRQKIKVKQLPANLLSIAWWQSHLPDLSSPNIEELVILEVERDAFKLPYELIEGSIQDWMLTKLWDTELADFVDNPGPHNHSFLAKPEVIKVKANYSIKDPDGKASTKVTGRELSITITTTNAGDPTMAKTYSRTTTTVTGGEGVPLGIARTLYESINRPQYEGQIVLVAEDVASSILVGCAVNLRGLKAEWATMLAPVQTLQYSLDTGHTSIRIGPPDHLAVQDLIEYMRINRTRKPATSNIDRISGGADSGSVELSSQHSRSEGSAGLGAMGEWLTVITDSRYDTASNQLQIKTREVRILAAQPESEWTLIDGGQAEACDGSTQP